LIVFGAITVPVEFPFRGVDLCFLCNVLISNVLVFFDSLSPPMFEAKYFLVIERRVNESHQIASS